MPHIYGIKNRKNGKMYVGKTTNIVKRFIRHKTLLKNDKHWNRHLQRSYNKYGPECFDYVMLEECTEDQMAEKEQHWIDTNKPNVYNEDLFVADKTTSRNSFYGRHHTEESRKMMSAAKHGRYEGCQNPNYGKSWSEEKKAGIRGSQNHRSKLTEDQAQNILVLLAEGWKHQDVATKYKVARTVVTRINSGSRWSHLRGEK